MDIEWIRRFCLSLSHSTEQVQWDDDLVFKIGGKMYALLPLQPRTPWISFKCSAEDFAELCERIGIRPAPYLARAQWVALDTADALSPAELKQQLQRAYEIVRAKLPKKQQALLARKK